MKRTTYVEIAGEPPVRCMAPAEMALHDGDDCIVEDNRVLEYGRVVRQEEPVADSAEAGPKIVRRPTLQDRAQMSETTLRSRMVKQTCAARAEKLNLPIRLVRVFYSFDRSVLRVVFSADERIDYRSLIRELSDELKVRVDMHQVGVRDEAGMIGGLGPCGRVMCCASWLRAFESINVRMAKAQQLSLNPTTIGGMCGRLKCCLRYEHECYRQLSQSLPREGAWVSFGGTSGVVVARDVLRQKLKVRTEQDGVVDLDAGEIMASRGGAPEPQDTKDGDSDDAVIEEAGK